MNTSLKVKDMTRIALCSVLMVICSQIIVPIGPVPFTLQTFAVFFVLEFLGGKMGTASVGLYIFLGMLGLPVFSGFSGGIGALLGPTGGYITGFLLMGFIYLIIMKFSGQGKAQRFAALVMGLIICYLFGTVWFIHVYGKGISFASAIKLCVLPFIVPDILKMILGILISDILKKRMA